MDYRFPQASSSRSEQPSTSRASGSTMPFSGSNPRTSSKRSFDEYGHLESQSTSGPSGSSSMMTTPTSSVVGAPAMLGLGNTSGIANHLGDPVNNAHNRNKRRRGSLSPPQAEGSLHIPSMPAGTSLSTSTPGQRAIGHSTSNSAESLMSWLDDTAPQVTLQQSVGQTTTTQVTEMSSVVNGGQNQTSRDLHNGDTLYESRPDRDNRMSWMPDTSQATDTVTTNTEPGWNFAPHGHNLGPTMDFTMPHAQSADVLNQHPPHFLERNPFETNSNENNGPQMPVPSFHPDIRPATSDFDNHTSPNLISPRSPSSLYMDSWYRSHDSRRNGPSHPIVPPSPIESPPSPPAWRDPSPQAQQQTTQPSPAEPSSWWPFRWGLDGAISPPPPPPQVTPRTPQEIRPNTSSSRPSVMHSAPMFLADNPPDYRSGPAQTSRPNFTRPWDSSRVEAPTSWPPYLIPGSSETPPPPRNMFPEPQNQGARRNNGYSSQPRDDHSMHRSGSRTFNDISPTIGPSSSTFSTFGNPSGTAGSRPHDPHALSTPSSMLSSRHSAGLYPPVGDRAMRSHEESTRSRTSGRVPSPPPTRRTILALQDILDRHTRNRNSGMDFDDWRPHHSRSNSDSSPVDPVDPQQRRGDRWREEMNFASGGEPFQRGFDRFGMERSIGPSTTRPRNSRPEPRSRPASFIYDYPSTRDLVSSHSNHSQERERRELHSSMASLARTPVPPAPTTRRPLSGLFDYTRGGNVASSASVHPIGRPPLPPSPTRPPPRSNSPVSSRPSPPRPSSRRPPSPASRPAPLLLDPFFQTAPNEPSERPSEPRSASMRTRQSRRRERESRTGRPLGVEHPLAWMGSDEDFPYYDSFNVNFDDPELSGLSITAAERIRTLSRFRAGRRVLPMGRMRALGDYVMDDDFDDSYEGLLALGQIVGPVKRGCSEGTLDGLPHGTYAEFSVGGSDANTVLGDNGNCAICLEDYGPTDSCTKLPRCKHFYHKDCVKEWLKTARTCPVCRENVEGAPRVKGGSRPSRVRFVPISEAQREPQDPALQYLRDTSGAGPATISAPRPPRRRSTNDGRPIPPPLSLFQDVERAETRNIGLERMRRLRVPPRMANSILGEFDDPWPTYSPPSPPNHPFSPYRRSPSPPPFMEAPGTSSRFTRGLVLARALGEGSIDDLMRSSNYN